MCLNLQTHICQVHNFVLTVQSLHALHLPRIYVRESLTSQAITTPLMQVYVLLCHSIHAGAHAGRLNVANC